MKKLLIFTVLSLSNSLFSAYLGEQFIDAASSGNIDAVKAYLDAGANPNYKDFAFKQTAIMHSAMMNHTEISNILLQAGANLDIRDNYGNTALILAATNGYIEIVNLLIQGGANLDIQNKYGNTAIILAATNGYTEIVDKLFQAGANPNITNKEDINGWQAAKQNSHKEIYNKLMKITSSPKLISDQYFTYIRHSWNQIDDEHFIKNIIATYPINSFELNLVLNTIIDIIISNNINPSRQILLTILRRIANDFVMNRLSTILPQEISLPIFLSSNLPYTDFNFSITMKDGKTEESLINLIEEDIYKIDQELKDRIETRNSRYAFNIMLENL
ncbi:hypothetical protein A3F66_05630 [candidate division TM6 bacterium RIFCSPHIGHO2_12_FULL_32_22]|nr:MAG: hypothetical protein A3F66_05630 [candidate division TM6 bacterium RIFCSPHIGHO2_12_FULL_32_22]